MKNKKDSQQQTEEQEIVSLLQKDYKVHEAINLLKGLHILSKKQTP